MDAPIEVEKRTRAVLYMASTIANYSVLMSIPASEMYVIKKLEMFKNIS